MINQEQKLLLDVLDLQLQMHIGYIQIVQVVQMQSFIHHQIRDHLVSHQHKKYLQMKNVEIGTQQTHYQIILGKATQNQLLVQQNNQKKRRQNKKIQIIIVAVKIQSHKNQQNLLNRKNHQSQKKIIHLMETLQTHQHLMETIQILLEIQVIVQHLEMKIVTQMEMRQVQIRVMMTQQ